MQKPLMKCYDKLLPTPKDTREERGFCPQGLSRGEKHEEWHIDVSCPDEEKYADMDFDDMVQTQSELHHKGLREELAGTIVNILAVQAGITSQGYTYDGEKDWALNKILQLITAKVEEARREEGDKATIHYEKVCKDQLKQSKHQWIERVREWASKEKFYADNVEYGDPAEVIKFDDLNTLLNDIDV